ncbi:MAG: ribonuclease P protein component [Flavobacteriales bacterium]
MNTIERPSNSQCFGKSSRLLNAADFKRVFDKAPLKASHPKLLILAKPSNHKQSRLGLVVAKKNIRLAVNRNQFKRVTRESFRLQQHLPAIDVIVLSRKNADSLTKKELFSVLEDLWKRLAKKAQKLQEKAD